MALATGFVACATTAPRRPPDEIITSAEVKAMHQTITTLGDRIVDLEAKITSMNQKLDVAAQAKPPSQAAAAQASSVGSTKGTRKKGASSASATTSGSVVGMDGIPVEKVGKPLQAMTGQLLVPERTSDDPARGFSEDPAIDSYRKALVLFRGGRYNEAIQGFSSYLELHADHVLAGSAQFYIGLSYFKLKELKLSLIELQRVLTSYDRSPHAAAALRYMAEAEDQLSLGGEAAKHRQMLSSLFPTSPDALVASGGAPAFPAAAPPPPAETSEYPADLPPPPDAEALKVSGKQATHVEAAPKAPPASAENPAKAVTAPAPVPVTPPAPAPAPKAAPAHSAEAASTPPKPAPESVPDLAPLPAVPGVHAAPDSADEENQE